MLKWIDRILRAFCLWLVVDSPVRLGRLAPPLFGYGVGAIRWIQIDNHEDRVLLGMEDEEAPDA